MTAVATSEARSRAPSRTLQGFPALASSVAAAAAPGWLRALRATAVARFSAVGLPSSNDEEWRFTSLQALASAHFGPRSGAAAVTAADLAQHLFGDPDWPLMVVVDGQVDQDLSRIGTLPDGVSIGSIAAAIRDDNPLIERHLSGAASVESTPFVAVNAALFVDGVVVHVGPGKSLPKPLHVLHVATGSAAGSIVAPRTLVVVDAGGSATVVESFVSVGAVLPVLTNAVAVVVMDNAARLEHVRVQREGEAAWHVGFTAVDQQRDSHYRSFTLAAGARLSRHDLHVRLGSSNIETLLYGLYLGRGEQLLDNHTAIFHDHPNCNSWEVYKGVLGGRSHGVFNGKVIVQPAAQKTDAKQTNRNLLLSEAARVDTKPQLEIFADDVKCTHGATVGKLNEQQRFYLRTRGIAGRAAELMLITAFVAEVLAEITQPQLRTALDTLVRSEIDAMVG